MQACVDLATHRRHLRRPARGHRQPRVCGHGQRDRIRGPRQRPVRVRCRIEGGNECDERIEPRWITHDDGTLLCRHRGDRGGAPARRSQKKDACRIEALLSWLRIMLAAPLRKRGWRLGGSRVTMNVPIRAVPATEPEGVALAEVPLNFEEFFQDHHARLFAALCLTTGSRDESEEIMQDAFLKIWERWDRVSRMDAPVGFLYRTAMNTFLKRYRRA